MESGKVTVNDLTGQLEERRGEIDVGDELAGRDARLDDGA
jgi:hypothetical protein